MSRRWMNLKTVTVTPVARRNRVAARLCAIAWLCALAVPASPVHGQTFAKDNDLNREIRSPFVQVAERVGPAVVSIATSRTFRHGTGENNPFEDMFRQFFPRGEQAPEEDFDMPGSGSGFMVSADGYILTNNHVINEATDIRVSLPNLDRPLDAVVVGTDPSTDLAVLKVEYREPLPFLEFGDSEDLKVGDWAIAIGNPLGQLAGSMTAGIVSAKGRSDLRIQGGTPRYQDFIQTDAAINFGNSGGPLVDIHGHVIGVNTAINASGQNIGFAIPINLVAKIYAQLVEKGRVSRGYLGVEMDELTPALAEGRDLDFTRGVIVQNVLEGTPAARAGLERGDIITRFGEAEIESMQDLRFRVADTPAGDRVKVQIYRDGKTRSVDVTLDEFDEGQVIASLQPADDAGERWHGLLIADIADRSNPRVRDLIDSFDIQEDEGVIVLDVVRGSSGDMARIRPGDVIVEIVNRSISGLGDFRDATEFYEGRDKPIAILLRRGNVSSYVTLEPDGE